MRLYHSLLTTTQVLPVSKSQANQRAGRAGRESAGICYRLFTEEAYCALETTTTPEIQRINIAQVVLQLKVLGVVAPSSFPFLSPPSDIALRKAFELLLILGALNKVRISPINLSEVHM